MATQLARARSLLLKMNLLLLCSQDKLLLVVWS